MLEENRKKVLDNNYLLNKRKDAHRKTVFTAIKNSCFLIGIFLGLICVITLYFVSDHSNIYHISVEGNVYLKDSDIIRLSGLDEGDKYLLTFPKSRERKLLSSPYIEEATVEMLDDRLVRITVKENKQVAYLFEDGESKILLANGERIVLDRSNYYLIEKLPLLEGYDKDGISEILRGFKQIEYETINEISEIHRYPFSYDENMMEVIMRDGNYCFLSWTGMKMLDEYYRIVSGIDTSLGNVCIYLDELTNSGYTSVCPWQDTAKPDTVTEE
ncbi:MAG: FtsQ-type POTRA domain-containing protein [Erysipelotrichaceae bacterium]|nr:FtsQ-type POTRA domain-containing protein [Erysipelotrichaceae bacterium]